jgi:SOS-response transcriptional repressor LexA
MTELNSKQWDLLMFLSEFVEEHGLFPTLREICTAQDWRSTNAASGALVRLEALGVIKRGEATKSRAWAITPLGHLEFKGWAPMPGGRFYPERRCVECGRSTFFDDGLCIDCEDYTKLAEMCPCTASAAPCCVGAPRDDTSDA